MGIDWDNRDYMKERDDPPEPVNCCSLPPRKTFWQRLGFGFAHALRHPMPEGVYDGRIVSDVFCVLDWRDRIRALVSGKLNVEVVVFTDVPVAKTISRSAISVLAPTFPMEKNENYSET